MVIKITRSKHNNQTWNDYLEIYNNLSLEASKKGKKLNLSKYMYFNLFLSKRLVWINNNVNFVNATKVDHEQLLKKIDPYKYKRYVEKIKQDDLDLLDMPEGIIDGIETGDFAKQYYRNKYPNFTSYDFENYKGIKNYKFLPESATEVERLLKEEDNFIIFEAPFKYGPFTIYVDALLKFDGRLHIREVKGITKPRRIHGYDVLYQKNILERLGYNVRDFTYKITTLNNKFILGLDQIANVKKMTLSKTKELEEVINNNIDNLLIEWDVFYNSRPSDDENDNEAAYIFDDIYETVGEAIDIAVNPFKILDKVETKEKKEKGINLYDFIFNQCEEEKNQHNLNESFDHMLKEVIEIQIPDYMPEEGVLTTYRQLDGTDYEDWLLKQADVEVEGSVFQYFGDSAFSFAKKAQLYLDGFKTIEETPVELLLPKSPFSSAKVSFSGEIKKIKVKPDSLLNWNNPLHKRVIQKKYFNSNEVYLRARLLKTILGQYRLYDNVPIYMFDFETAKHGIPKVIGTRPYEQIPYQFSIHVITNSQDFDYKTLKNIKHYEFLAKEPNNFYIEFWNEFAKAITSHGEGIYVSYNKSFENMIIKQALIKPDNIVSAKVKSTIQYVMENTIDLMDFFKDFSFYTKEFKGSRSIKTVGPYFAPDLDYSKLNNIKKGDVSSFNAKVWIIDPLKYKQHWINIRNDMLKYCLYDTLSMVAILQGLIKILDDKLVYNHKSYSELNNLKDDIEDYKKEETKLDNKDSDGKN